MITTIIIVAICILLEGFFSGSEIALISANKIKIHKKAEEGNKFAKMIQKMFKNPERLLGTTLVGTNTSTVIGSVVMTSYLVSKFPANGAFYAVIIMFPIILILGEIIPKIIYQGNADKICYIIIAPIRFFSYIVFPLVYFLTQMVEYALSIFPKSNRFNGSTIGKDELKLIIDSEKRAVDLKKNEREMIKKIFDFGDITVKEVMTPLVEIVAIEKNASIHAVIRKAEKEEYSRLPVYDGRIYNIVGVVNIFDLLFLPVDYKVTISDIMRPVYYVPRAKRVDDLLNELQQSENHMAVVVNEYGGSIGVVTIEDILEEIVGEIEDEYDSVSKLYVEIDEKTYSIDARMEIDAINEQLKLKIPKGNYETLSGFILEKLEKIPKKGDNFINEGLSFNIERADEKSIKNVTVKKLKKK